MTVKTTLFALVAVSVVSVATYRADTCRLTFGETGQVEVTPVTAVPAGTAVRTAS